MYVDVTVGGPDSELLGSVNVPIQNGVQNV